MTRPPRPDRDAPAGPVSVVNLTLHPVTVYDADRPVASWPPSGAFARLVESHAPAPTVLTEQGPVPVTEISYAPTVADLPEPVPGTVFLVSRVLAAAVPRGDLLFPAEEVRDDHGQIIGCRTLARFAAPPRPPGLPTSPRRRGCLTAGSSPSPAWTPTGCGWNTSTRRSPAGSTSLAEHAANDKPYTVSPLTRGPRGQVGVEIATLTDSAEERLHEATAGGTTIRLGNQTRPAGAPGTCWATPGRSWPGTPPTTGGGWSSSRRRRSAAGTGPALPQVGTIMDALARTWTAWSGHPARRTRDGPHRRGRGPHARVGAVWASDPTCAA